MHLYMYVLRQLQASCTSVKFGNGGQCAARRKTINWPALVTTSV